MPKADLSGEGRYILSNIVSLMVIAYTCTTSQSLDTPQTRRRSRRARRRRAHDAECQRKGYIPGIFYPTMTLFKQTDLEAD